MSPVLKNACLVFVFFAAVTAAAHAVPPLFQMQPGILEGRVLDSATQGPIAGVEIVFSRLHSDIPPDLIPSAQDISASMTRLPELLVDSMIEIQSEHARTLNLDPALTLPLSHDVAVTDSNGRFSVRDLQPGLYTIEVWKEGYYAFPRPQSKRKIVIVAPGNAPPIQFFMAKGAVVSGRVVNSRGESVPIAAVTLYSEFYRRGRPEWLESVGFSSGRTTDDRGEFRIYPVPPSRYILGVTLREAAVLPVQAFYPGTHIAAAATPISVEAGVELTEIRISIPEAPATYSISGAVLNPAPEVPANPLTGIVERAAAAFLIRRWDEQSGKWTSQHRIAVQPGPNGEFTIDGVPSGRYELLPAFPRSRFEMRAIVDVQNDDVSDVVFSEVVMVPDVALEATLVIEAAGDADLSSVGFGWVTPADAPPDARVINYCCERFDGGGKLRTTAPPGRYLWHLPWLPQTAYVSDVLQDGRSVFDRGMDLTGLRETRIQIQVKTDGGSIQGRVRTATDRSAAPYATVILVPAPAVRRNDTLFKVAYTGEQGLFAIHGIPPGAYTLLAFGTIPAGEPWLNPGFLERYERRGQKIDVGARALLGTDLELLED